MPSKPTLKHSKGIQSIRMQILTIRKGFEAFEKNSNNSQGIRSIQMEIRTIRKGFEGFETKFEPFERDSKHSIANSKHSKGIRCIRMHIATI